MVCRVALVILLVLLPSVLCQKCNIPAWLEGRVQPVPANSATLLDKMEQTEDVIQALRNITKFFNSLDRRISQVDEVLGIPRVCLRNENGLNSVDVLSDYYGYGGVEKCLTKIHYSSQDEDERREKSDEIHQASLELIHQSAEAGERLKEEGLLPWERVDSNRLFIGSSETKYCNLVKASGHRVNGKWYTKMSVFNLDPSRYEDQGIERKIYSQMLHVDEGASQKKIKSFPLNLTQCRDGQFVGRKTTDAIISTWDGTPSWSDFISLELRNNPAIRGGLRDGDISAQMFDDVDSTADVAIFLLPLVMALIPAALFNNVRNLATLSVYILLDLVAAVPIGLKSFELLLKSQERKKFTEVYYYGNQNAASSESVAAEVFVANCGLTDRFRRIGRDLLIITCILTAASILLDVWFFVLLRRRKRAYARRALEGGGIDMNSPEFVTSSPGADLMWYWSYERKNK